MDVDINPTLAWRLRVGNESPAIKLPHFAPVWTHAVDNIRTGIYQCSESFFAFAQCFFCFFAFRDVLDDSEHPRLIPEPPALAVEPAHPELRMRVSVFEVHL